MPFFHRQREFRTPSRLSVTSCSPATLQLKLFAEPLIFLDGVAHALTNVVGRPLNGCLPMQVPDMAKYIHVFKKPRLTTGSILIPQLARRPVDA
jgi:hypothetical protein